VPDGPAQSHAVACAAIPEIYHLQPRANHLIESLPRADRRRLLKICDVVELGLAEILFERDTRTKYVYFPTGSVISLLTPIEDRPVLEVSMVGSEGMLGTQMTLGIGTTVFRARVQIPGSAWRAAAVPFRRELMRSIALQRSVNRYLHVTIVQLAAAARCIRIHDIGERLARWLLMAHDRTHTDTFDVTHAFIASMLGVRRVSITLAAVALQRGGLIEYAHGTLTVLNRQALESVACDCYATDQNTYARFLP
jgi:CRP-like cAMP-binding protein